MTDHTDLLTRFHLPDAHVRGAFVRLDHTWQHVASRADYPPVVGAWLGEALAATALFASILKADGRLSVQLRGTGALRTLFAECTAKGQLRGIARLAEDATALPAALRDLGEGAVLALTLESPPRNAGEPHRYQGIVPMEAATLSGAFEDYFRQSEQLPTRLLLAADGARCAGLMVQALPGQGDAEHWARVNALFDTLGSDEMLATEADLLLHRLFHEEAPEIVARQPLAFGCSCSRARVEEVFLSIGRDEAMAALQDGEAEVTCEFCGQRYAFDSAQLSHIFERQTGTPDVSDAVH